MSVTTVLALLAVGLVVGTISGMLGIGGAILIIPVLMIGFGFSQVKANGTSMAMLLPPIGIFAVLQYWRSGNIDLRFAAWMALGFTIGAYVGAVLVNSGKVNPTVLRFMFAAVILYVASRLILRPGGKLWEAGIAVIVTFLGLCGARLSSEIIRRSSGKSPRPAQRVFEMQDYEI